MKWLIDEMLPPATVEQLEKLGHDAVCVADTDLAGAPDRIVFELALAEGRVVVTENFADFSRLLEQQLSREEPCAPVLFVLEARHPKHGALPTHLARRLDAWAVEHPDPYPGPHWL